MKRIEVKMKKTIFFLNFNCIFVVLFKINMKPEQLVIQFGGLGTGTHVFEYDIKDKFFEQFEYSEVKKAHLQLSIDFVKQNSVITLHLKINGTVGIICDRCAGDYDFPISIAETIFLKNGDVAENNDNLIVLPFGESEVDLTKYIYELTIVALPVRRVPCEIDKLIYKCDKETLKNLNKFSIEEKSKSSEKTIWDELKKVKFKNN